MNEMQIKYESVNFSDPEEIEDYAKHLEGMSFQEVVDLGICPENGKGHDYDRKEFKGGLGNLLEECFFGYAANSTQGPDFEEAGVELKSTPFDITKKGTASAGERLVLTMVPLEGPVEDDFYKSHVWEKCHLILLIYYERNKSIPHLEQRIRYVKLFTPSEEDLKIIRDDYEKIIGIIKEGRAEDLSEGLTSYLGACTKGATAASSLVKQFYPPHAPAKKRAFALKRQYMDYVLHNYLMGSHSDESIVKDPRVLADQTFEEYVISLINEHIGMTDRELCAMLGLEYKGNKAQWNQITYALLGVRSGHAEEFQKANVSVRTVRIEPQGNVRESLSLNTFDFIGLLEEDWETAPLHEYFEETRFLFVAFQKEVDNGGREVIRLAGARFWSMPQRDIEGPLKKCWEETRRVIRDGVELVPVIRDGEIAEVKNNLPKASANPVAHVRPHTGKSAYVLGDGTVINNPERDAAPLPDGRMMTRQSFWLNSEYIHKIVEF